MGGRGLKHDHDLRQYVLSLIDEAVKAGARQSRACKILDIEERTIQRWRAQDVGTDQRRGPRNGPANKLPEEQRKEIIEIVTSPEFCDLSPQQIVPTLADRGIYKASESTMYRILREEKMQKHRQEAKPGQKNKPRQKTATRILEVWSWDITYLPTAIKGIFYYLYMVLDVFSRKIVAWEVHEKESQDLSAQMLGRAVREQQIEPGLILHSDNGGAMKGATMLAKMRDLKVIASFSRPRVSDDNPYSESLFRTLKYRPWYPQKAFANLAAARGWVDGFVEWYNEEHKHSGIGFVTPSERHSGRDIAILEQRKVVYEAARKENPERWSGETRAWDRPTEVILNPDGKTETQQSEGGQSTKEQSRGLRKGRQQTVRDDQRRNKQPNSPLATGLKTPATSQSCSAPTFTSSAVTSARATA